MLHQILLVSWSTQHKLQDCTCCTVMRPTFPVEVFLIVQHGPVMFLSPEFGGVRTPCDSRQCDVIVDNIGSFMC